MRVNIRGIGAIGNTTIEPSVAIFLDGAYVPRAGAVVSSMLDIESVEVLRGPQGTLFGRNASVGALSLHSAPPRYDLSGRVTGEIGTGDRYKVNGVVNLPVSDNAAFRFAAQKQWFGGYWHNKLDDKQYGGTDDTVLRGSFRAEVGPVDWVFRADYTKLKGDGVRRHRARRGFGFRSASSRRSGQFSRAVPTPTSTTKISTSSSLPIWMTSSGASTAPCRGTSAAVRRSG